MNILLIDDDEIILTALSFKLKELGHDIYIATDGSKAVDIAMGNTFDLIICDLMMPVISGATFLSMRENFISKNIPAIAMSSLGEGNEILNKLNINFDFYLKKPIQFEQLIGLIRKIEMNSLINY